RCPAVLSHDAPACALYTPSLHDALPICHGGHGGAREHLLGAADVVPEGAAVAQLGGGGGAFEAFPQFGFALSDGLADVGDERGRSEEHTSELQSRENLVCRLLLEKENNG